MHCTLIRDTGLVHNSKLVMKTPPKQIDIDQDEELEAFEGYEEAMNGEGGEDEMIEIEEGEDEMSEPAEEGEE